VLYLIPARLRNGDKDVLEERWNITFDEATWKMFWREGRWNIIHPRPTTTQNTDTDRH
jgi:hypothetical protein